MITKIIDKIIIIVLILVVAFMSFLLYKSKEAKTEMPQETAIQIASSITVLRPSFMTYSQVQKVLKGTGLAGYETAFLKAEEQSGIAADYLIAIAAHESQWGTNYWWKSYNNCFSWGITDSGVNNEGYKISKMSKADAIVYTANQIKSQYLTKGGSYYAGETLAAINTHYASDTQWAAKVLNIHKQIVAGLPETTLAKQFVMESRIIRGNLPSPYYFTEDYWSSNPTLEQLAIYLYRIQNAK
jgi:beta-N-acetylglucosaminidase